MIVSRNGKIHEGIDPWLFDGMKDVFSSCRYLHSGVIHLPDSRCWDFSDLEIPNCPKCSEKMDVGGRPSWRLTKLPLKIEDNTPSMERGHALWGWLELIISPFVNLSRWWNDP